MSLLHPLAVLAILGTPTPRSENKWLWCEAAPDFRTLYYPWRGGSTCASQRGMLVDRHKILEQNGYHLARQVLGKPEASVELGQLHLTIGHLDRLSRSDSVKPHLAHPSLSEIYPAFSAEEGEDAPPEFSRTERELFGRVRYGAALDQLRDFRAELCRPAVAPFALFGVSAGADVHRALSHPALASSPGGVGARLTFASSTSVLLPSPGSAPDGNSESMPFGPKPVGISQGCRFSRSPRIASSTVA